MRVRSTTTSAVSVLSAEDVIVEVNSAFPGVFLLEENDEETTDVNFSGEKA